MSAEYEILSRGIPQNQQIALCRIRNVLRRIFIFLPRISGRTNFSTMCITPDKSTISLDQFLWTSNTILAYTQFSISILSFLQTLHTRSWLQTQISFLQHTNIFFTTHTFLSKNTLITLYSAVISQDTLFPTYLNTVHTCVLFSTLFSNRMSVSTLITLYSSDC